MNIFKNYKATKDYLEYLESLPQEKKAKFTALVKAKFYEKVTSSDELDDYTITEADVAKIYDQVEPNG